MESTEAFHQDTIAQLLTDNRVLIEKLTKAVECSDEQVPVVMREVIRFLYLVSCEESGMLTPSHRVDLAWHEFILCTKTYHKFCATYFGHYIHHTPGGEGPQNKKQFHLTLSRYTEKFGAPPAEYWGPSRTIDAASDCGACESG